jgi:carbonic anhydrase/acetyltransferase-like protein (isoleucine patch superfamily)
MLVEFEGKRPRLGKDVFIAPTAVLIGDVEVGDGTSVWFGTVLRADFGPIKIGRNCSIQDNSVLHSDSGWPTIIGDNVTIGHNVTAEACCVGNNSLLGSGSVVLPFTTIGERTLLAANSTVLENSEFPPDVLLAGSPAKIKGNLTGRALDWTQFAIDDYTKLQARYRAQNIDGLKIA